MFETFKMRAEAVSAEVHRFGTKAEAFSFITNFLINEGTSDAPENRALWAGSSFLTSAEKQDLSKYVPGLKFEVSRQLASEARIGISQMDWAIANTGTLAQDSTSVDQRLVSALPWIHIALIGSDKIVPDLATFIKKMHPSKNGYIRLITGPSRTADIERVLTKGVHGPERLVVVFVDNLGGMN
jgi:L-lactate dehydrogenase complex protein LldG